MKGPSSFYRPELNLLRFTAFFFIFLHHIFLLFLRGYRFDVSRLSMNAFTSIGNSFQFGMGISFFISAYLITTLLMLENEDFGKIDLTFFYIRRILRIWPLYFTGILVGVLACWRSHPEQLQMFKYFALFGANFYFSNHLFTLNGMNLLWSISVQEQFYFLFPLLMRVLGVSRVFLIGTCFVLGSLIALFVQGEDHSLVVPTIWTNTLSHFVFFGTGILCAFWMRGKKNVLSDPARAAFAGTAFLLFVAGAYYLKVRSYLFASSGLEVVLGFGISVAGVVLLLFSFLDLEHKVPEPLNYLGKISYGLYVWHFLFLVTLHDLSLPNALLFTPVALLATIMLSALSYRYLELPFLRLKDKFTYVVNRRI
jgi:peptidoglycan/LPS O-acetylase OafA/YrhL